MKPVRWSVAVVVAALIVAGCGHDAGTGPSPRESSPDFSRRGRPSTGGPASYLILNGAGSLPPGLARHVERAGGALTGALPQIGVAFATSGATDFTTRASWIPGVGAVVQDTLVRWVYASERVVPLGDAAPGGGVGAAGIGNDERFSPIQWALQAIHAPAAWDAGARGKGVRVAVIDGGIRNTHIDLRDNIDNARSRSFVSGFAFNQDVSVFGFSHATHVAGIIAAEHNGIGTIGIAPEATIIGVKALHGVRGEGTFEAVIQAIVYAATPISEGGAGADIINMSLAGSFYRRGRDAALLAAALGRATSYAHQRGVTVFAAAGNGATDFDHTRNLVILPAQSPHVIAIAATGPDGFGLGATDFDLPATYTNFGKSLVSFAAPGGNDALLNTPQGTVSCTRPLRTGFLTLPCVVFDFVLSPGSMNVDNVYFFAEGTSASAPAAAGVAALIIEKYGRIGPARVEAQLRHGADDLGKRGKDDFYGLGRVNAFNAVR